MKRWSKVVVLALAFVLAMAPVDVSAETQDQEVSALVAPVSAELAAVPSMPSIDLMLITQALQERGLAGSQTPATSSVELSEEAGAVYEPTRAAAFALRERPTSYASGEYDVLKMPHA